MRTLIITGGSSGIGQAAADLFAAKGYKVYELSRHGEDRAGVTHIDCDVTSPDDCRNAAAKVATEAGKIDVLISNAGMGISGAIEFTDINEAKRQFDVNFFGAVNIAQAVLPYMRNEHDGKIIFVSSLAATFPIPYQAFYSASKAAINAMARGARIWHKGVLPASGRRKDGLHRLAHKEQRRQRRVYTHEQGSKDNGARRAERHHARAHGKETSYAGIAGQSVHIQHSRLAIPSVCDA